MGGLHNNMPLKISECPSITSLRVKGIDKFLIKGFRVNSSDKRISNWGGQKASTYQLDDTLVVESYQTSESIN